METSEVVDATERVEDAGEEHPACPVLKSADLLAVPFSSKKGLCLSRNHMDRWSSLTEGMRSSWHYSWSFDTSLPSDYPLSVEYVPMFWGRKSVTEENLNHVREAIAQGRVRHLLGFNEPDLKQQANMKASEALELWPLLSSLGIPVGSPVLAHLKAEADGDPWMNEFLAGAQERGVRVGFLALHHYADPKRHGKRPLDPREDPTVANNFLRYVAKVHQRYQLPIWITEFGVRDASKSGAYSSEEVLHYMQYVIPQLQKLDFVHRFAWFSPQSSRHEDFTGFAKLFEITGDYTLTALGSYYSGEDGHGLDKCDKSQF